MRRKLGPSICRKVRYLGWSGTATVAVFLAAAVPAQADPYVYVANSGSSTVSQHSIGAGGKLIPLSPATVTVSSGAGDVAVSPDTKSVYVVGYDINSGDGTVSQYNVDAQGRLSPKSPATVDAETYPTGVTVAPDGRSLFVGATNSGDQDEGVVFQYDVDAQGRLSPKSPAMVDMNGHPSDVAVTPDGKSLYATTGGYRPIAQFDIDPLGRLSPKSDTTDEICHTVETSIEVSPNGRIALVTCEAAGGGAVFSYGIDAYGRLSPAGYCCGSSHYPRDVAVSPDGKSLYANHAVISPDYDSGLFQEDVGANGELSPKDPPWIASASNQHQGEVVVSPDGRSVYAADYAYPDGGGMVDQYDIGAGGVLSPKNPATVVAGGDYASGIAVSPDTASVSVSHKTLVFTPAQGSRDDVAITRPSSSTLRVTDSPSFPYTGAPMRAGTGCTTSGPYTVNCHGEIARVQVTAGDLADRIVNSTGVQSSLFGGKGSDMLTGGFGIDTLNGGPDPDVMKGGNGNDRLLARDRSSDTTVNCDGGIGTPGHADRADLDQLPLDPNSVVSGCESKTRY